MQPKQQRQSEEKGPTGQKSIIIPSTKASNDFEGEETEITVQVTVAPDGGWGWVVLVAAFIGVAILDGNLYSFGAYMSHISKDLETSDSVTAFINSAQVSMYLMCSPGSSALVNRFGFRAITMVGSIICSIAHFATYYANNFVYVIILYGFIHGFGCSLLNMGLSLVPGFYFEKLRSAALATISIGTSVGVMVMYPLNTELIRLGGWRTAILVNSGLFGIIYFLSLTFRPLLTLTVTTTDEERGSPTRTVTFLPSVSVVGLRQTMPRTSQQSDALQPTRTEKLMGAVSNAHFPTAATIVKESTTPQPPAGASQARTSGAGVSRIKLKAQSAVSRQQLKQIQSIMSTKNVQDPTQNVEIAVEVSERKSKSCWGRCCDWESHPPEDRPMYRDDVFYEGNIKKLPAYQKSVMGVAEDQRTGLEYQMAVSRAVAVNDLQDRRGVCTTAVRRVLVTMLDPNLLKRVSFLLYCLSGFFTYAGLLVVYVYLQDRGISEGIDSTQASFFMSVSSFSNMIGRGLSTWLAMKIDPLIVYGGGLLLSGISTILSGLSFSLYYQFGYCIFFGLASSSCVALRCIVIVEIYGLENLTNGYGIFLLSKGLASTFSTPLAGLLKDTYGYNASFYVAGAFILIAGLTVVPMKIYLIKEQKKEKKDAEKSNKEKIQKKENSFEISKEKKSSLTEQKKDEKDVGKINEEKIEKKKNSIEISNESLL